MGDTFDRVKKIVVKNLKVEESKIKEDSSFVEDLGADSLDQVELVMDFEEEFGIEIPEEIADKITTIKKAVEYIEQNS
jgi:acyl carrier protein